MALASNTTLQCGTAGGFTNLDFSATELIVSNIGGQGGRCESVTWDDGSSAYWADLCLEPTPGITHTDAGGVTVPPNIPDNLGSGPFYSSGIQGLTTTGAPYGNEHLLFRKRHSHLPKQMSVRKVGDFSRKDPSQLIVISQRL